MGCICKSKWKFWFFCNSFITISSCLHSWHCPIWKTVSKAQLKNFDGIFFSTLRVILTLRCTINDLAHQLQIAISSWEMLRFLLPIQSFIVLMGFVSLLAIPGHKSCKKVALVNSYLAPRQKKDKLEKSPKHFRTKQSSNWNYNYTKKTVSPFWLIGCFSSQCLLLTILKVFYFTPSSIYSCFLSHIWDHEFCHLGCWAAIRQKGKISETTEFLLKYATFWSGFFNFLWAKKKLF